MNITGIEIVSRPDGKVMNFDPKSRIRIINGNGDSFIIRACPEDKERGFSISVDRLSGADKLIIEPEAANKIIVK